MLGFWSNALNQSYEEGSAFMREAIRPCYASLLCGVAGMCVSWSSFAAESMVSQWQPHAMNFRAQSLELHAAGPIHVTTAALDVAQHLVLELQAAAVCRTLGGHVHGSRAEEAAPGEVPGKQGAQGGERPGRTAETQRETGKAHGLCMMWVHRIQKKDKPSKEAAMQQDFKGSGSWEACLR